MKGKVVIITTGGTIAMITDPVSGASIPAQGINKHVANIKGLDELADVEHISFQTSPVLT